MSKSMRERWKETGDKKGPSRTGLRGGEDRRKRPTNGERGVIAWNEKKG